MGMDRTGTQLELRVIKSLDAGEGFAYTAHFQHEF